MHISFNAVSIIYMHDMKGNFEIRKKLSIKLFCHRLTKINFDISKLLAINSLPILVSSKCKQYHILKCIRLNSLYTLFQQAQCSSVFSIKYKMCYVWVSYKIVMKNVYDIENLNEMNTENNHTAPCSVCVCCIYKYYIQHGIKHTHEWKCW